MHTTIVLGSCACECGGTTNVPIWQQVMFVTTAAAFLCAEAYALFMCVPVCTACAGFCGCTAFVDSRATASAHAAVGSPCPEPAVAVWHAIFCAGCGLQEAGQHQHAHTVSYLHAQWCKLVWWSFSFCSFESQSAPTLTDCRFPGCTHVLMVVQDPDSGVLCLQQKQFVLLQASAAAAHCYHLTHLNFECAVCVCQRAQWWFMLARYCTHWAVGRSCIWFGCLFLSGGLLRTVSVLCDRVSGTEWSVLREGLQCCSLACRVEYEACVTSR